MQTHNNPNMLIKKIALVTMAILFKERKMAKKCGRQHFRSVIGVNIDPFLSYTGQLHQRNIKGGRW